MSQVEQTKEQYLEAVNELLDHIHKQFKGLLEHKEPSDNLKRILDYLRNNPELTKNILQKMVANDLKENFETFKKHNKDALDKINQLKRGIDLSTDKGKALYQSLDSLEKKHIDKEKEVEKMFGKFINTKEKDNSKNEKQREKSSEMDREIEFEIE